jgi:hypothetical protein
MIMAPNLFSFQFHSNGGMKQLFDRQTRPKRHDDFTDNYHSTWAGSAARCLIIIILLLLLLLFVIVFGSKIIIFYN